MELIVTLIGAAGIMGILDFIWLGVVAKKLYYDELGQVLLEKPNMTAALVFYVIYVLGVTIFVIEPGLNLNSWEYTFVYVALFGLVAYATYDLTNLATMKGFKLKVALIDIAWGILLTLVVSVGSYAIVKLFT
jgi:uncharacterized membrane protein